MVLMSNQHMKNMTIRTHFCRKCGRQKLLITALVAKMGKPRFRKSNNILICVKWPVGCSRSNPDDSNIWRTSNYQNLDAPHLQRKEHPASLRDFFSLAQGLSVLSMTHKGMHPDGKDGDHRRVKCFGPGLNVTQQGRIQLATGRLCTSGFQRTERHEKEIERDE